ncbi:pyridoxamine 5'-phosphate oxidase family protein [Mobilitalea sibirica]|uniref:Pyridoxamine 5'-phosphate oxidase family protein n=1 Tax=Mobilitalea sibirica TaxID=1462919 RepID=A0A8J7HC49_9FIRM|nr:pyridoxamine 5'-phosphate oxidase family protein [Mobilitalea sibirica]MBH1941771.1 pyridoxamine 5'-phosphate oxidase family protein [Mobilitalea sibirica]
MEYKDRFDQLFQQLGSHKTMVLATSADNRTTARMMSCIMLNNKIYCQTDIDFQKSKQILKNPFVALCVDNIQIEGEATIKGSPMEECNSEFVEAFKTYFRGSYDTYSSLSNEIVIEIAPTLITLYCYDNKKPYREFIDCKQQKVHIKQYEIGR